MNIRVRRKEFTKHLNNLLRILDRKSIEPVSNFVFFLENHIAASDGKSSIKMRVPGMEGVQESFGIQHKKLLEILRATEEEELSLLFDRDNMWVNIKGENFQGSLPGIPGDAFLVDFSEPESKITVPLEVLSESMEKVSYAAPSGSSSFGTDGIKVFLGNGVLFTLATDGFRLAYYERNIAVEEEPISFVLPKRVARAIPRIFEGEFISIARKGAEVFFSTQDMTLISATYEDTFPKDMENLKARVGDSFLSISKEELSSALRKVRVFDDKGIGARFLLSPRDPLKIRFEEEQGRVEVELKGEYVGDSLEIVVDEKGLLEIINNISSPQVKLEFFGERNPIMIKESGENFLYINLITPLTI